jgi:hypothetical protein
VPRLRKSRKLNNPFLAARKELWGLMEKAKVQAAAAAAPAEDGHVR